MGRASGLSDHGDPGSKDWGAIPLEIFAGASSATRRFPVTVLLLVLLAVMSSPYIEDFSLFGERNSDIRYSLAIASVAALAVTLRGEASGLGRLTTFAVGMIAALAFAALGWWHQAAELARPHLALALAALVFVAPCLGRGSTRAFWTFGLGTGLAIALGGLVLLLLCGGLSVILASLDFLFGVEIPTAAYRQVWVIGGVLVAPVFALGRFPSRFDREIDLAPDSFAGNGMRALSDFVGAPMLLFYAAMLHVYAVKIALTGTVPDGRIGPLVLGYGLCLFAVLVGIYPLLAWCRAPTRLLQKVWPFLLPVPATLLFVALGQRLQAYGVTPDRYMLGIFGVALLLLAVLQFRPGWRGDIRHVVAVPAIALLLTSAGPWGAVGVSVESQVARLRALAANRTQTDSEIEWRRSVRSALAVLEQHDALERISPNEFTLADSGDKATLRAEIDKYFELDRRPTERERPDRKSFTFTATDRDAFSVKGFDVAVRWETSNQFNGTKAIHLPGGGMMTVMIADQDLETSSRDNGWHQVVFPSRTVVERVEALTNPATAEEAAQGRRLAIMRFAAGGREMRIVLMHVSGDREPAFRLSRLDAILLLRAADWQ